MMDEKEIDNLLEEISLSAKINLTNEYPLLPIALKLFLLCQRIAIDAKLAGLLFRAVAHVTGIANL